MANRFGPDPTSGGRRGTRLWPQAVAIASYSGHDAHPAWFLNLEAEPEASLLLDGVSHGVRARVTEGDERAKLWAQMAELNSDYTDYQEVTDREIPVLVLERI